MMMNLCSDVIRALQGKTLVTAESCTGGGIGQMLTSVPGSSAVFKGGIISYSSQVKVDVLKVSAEDLKNYGAVSEPVAKSMAAGVKQLLNADVAVSATGLAGPDGDEFSNQVGTVFIGYCDANHCFARKFHFFGNREAVRQQAAEAALNLVLEMALAAG